jgi:hypothetical protein
MQSDLKSLPVWGIIVSVILGVTASYGILSWLDYRKLPPEQTLTQQSIEPIFTSDKLAEFNKKYPPQPGWMLHVYGTGKEHTWYRSLKKPIVYWKEIEVQWLRETGEVQGVTVSTAATWIIEPTLIEGKYHHAKEYAAAFNGGD